MLEVLVALILSTAPADTATLSSSQILAAQGGDAAAPAPAAPGEAAPVPTDDAGQADTIRHGSAAASVDSGASGGTAAAVDRAPRGTVAVSTPDSVSAAPARPRKVMTGDSAALVWPPRLKPLEGTSVLVTVEPRCPVRAVDVLVRYFPKRLDTIGHCYAPPFAARWNFAGIPDQDQFHLQFGYILHHSNGDTIVAPPLPNNWMLDRGSRPSNRRFTCRRAAADSSVVVDAVLDEWTSFRAVRIGSAASLRCAWTAGQFLVAAEVTDSSVNAYDRIEVMFDLKHERGLFAGIGQRVLTFGPRSRSFSWAVDLGDTVSKQIDSLIIRIDEEVEWRARQTGSGYVIEARIPFCVLSDLQFPRKRFGFDLCVVDFDSLGDGQPEIVSWSGALPSARHSPARWGTVDLRQRMPALKVLLVFLLLLSLGIILLVLVLALRQKQRDGYCGRREARGPSPFVKRIVDHMRDSCWSHSFTIDDLAASTGAGRDEIREALVNEMYTSFDRLLEQMRVRKAKVLLRETEESLATVARACGFGDDSAFIRSFSYHAGVPPDQWREDRRGEDSEDDDESDEVHGQVKTGE